MAINLVRIPSDTPNISPADDCRMFKYAVGGVDGYVKGYGQECEYTVNGREFTVQSGEIVADGYQVSIDSNGASVTALSSSSTYYYTVYAEVDLRISDSPAVSIKSSYSLTEYPTVDIGDNLTVNSSGVHRVPLYQFKVQNGSISDVTKVIRVLDYTSADQIVEINRRLDELGFKQGVAETTILEGLSSPVISNSLKKQGKYCIFMFSSGPGLTSITIPKEFRPKTDSSILVGVSTITQLGEVRGWNWFKISALDGTIRNFTSDEILNFSDYFNVAIGGGWELP